MAINAIEHIGSQVQSITRTADNTAQEGNSFANILQSAVDQINETELAAQAANEAVLTGESDDLHTAVIAAQKAEIAVSYAAEIRNRMLEAYDKIMNMQI